MAQLEIKLNGKEHIDLCDLLKVADLCPSAGIAKHIIANQEVKVDGAIETRNRCKIRTNQVVHYDGHEIKVT